MFADDRARRKQDGINPNEVGVYDCLFVQKAKQNDDLMCSPIYEWTDSEVWQFVEDRGMKYNPLYDKGFKRVGCIGCPMASNQVAELEMYPKYKQNFINAFDRMLKKRAALGKDDKTGHWKDAESCYKWWVNDTSIEGQMDIFEFLDKDGDEQ